ncbi:MAG: C1 family peptidase [Nitrospirota bacterium]|nr:C1 family peptidase [Nitrospirota bacterium]
MPKVTIKGKIFDARPDRIDLRDREYQPRLRSLPPQFPSVNSIKQYSKDYAKANLILDQGEEGACTGFGLAAVINYLRWRLALDQETPVAPKVSERMLYHLAKQYDEWPGEDYEGSSCRGAMKGWHRHGVCLESTWPYRDADGHVDFVAPKTGWDDEAANCPLGAYYRVNKDSITDMQSALCEVGALFVSGDVHNGWFPKRNKFPTIGDMAYIELPKTIRDPGGHAFSLVGYTELGFIVQNSWGPTWGTNGFAILTYPDWIKHGMDAWVAVLGAPMVGGQSRRYQTPKSLNASTNEPAQALGLFNRKTLASTRSHPEVEPWDLDTAYDHSIVLGNNGTVLNRSLIRETALDSLQDIVLANPRSWLEQGNKKIVIYAHGGLNSEEAAMNRIRVMAPYLKANGLYPLFFRWRTGFLESLVNITGDAVVGIEPQGAWKDIWDSVKHAAKEAKDRAIEAACQRLVVKAVWSEMKQNARAAAKLKTPTLGLVADSLLSLHAQYPKMEIHFMGHSAGSILLGYFLDIFVERTMRVDSCTLFAPACSVGFALNHYKPAIEARGVLRKSDLTIEILDDAAEQADSVGPYGKSLLYLVSRALENYHKTPLWGMANAWNPKANTTWHPDLKDSVVEWQKFWGSGTKPTLHSGTHVSDGIEKIPLAHGSFDNDVATIGRTLKRLLGKNLKFPIENLQGF